MNIRTLLVLSVVLVVASCEQHQETAKDEIPGCTTGNRIEITYPDDSGKPKADPDCLHVKRPKGNGAVMVNFVVRPENGKDTKIEFTQANAVESEGAALESQGTALQSERTASNCRTPMPPKGGKPQCVVNVTGTGSPRSISIAEVLETCDRECDVGETDCIKQHCSYKYSVQDVAGEHDLLDPEVITDPR